MTLQLRSLKINVSRLVQTRPVHSFALTQSVNNHDKDPENVNPADCATSSLLQELSERLQEIQASSLKIKEHLIDTVKCYSQPPKGSNTGEQVVSNITQGQNSVINYKDVNKKLVPVDVIGAVRDCVIPYTHTCDDILLHHQSPKKNFLLHCDTTFSDIVMRKDCIKVPVNISNHTDVISRDNYTVSFTCGGSSHNDKLQTWLYLTKPNTDSVVDAASLQRDSTDFCSDGGKVSPSKPPQGGELKGSHNKPSIDQLQKLQDRACAQWPYFFVKQHDYSMYTADVILENRLFKKHIILHGISRYVFHAYKLRIGAHFRFASVRMKVLKATVSERDGTVMLRWRVSGIPNLRAFMFWKFLPWRYKQAVDDESIWIDGFSILHVNGDGVAYKHCIEKVIPEGEEEVVSTKDKMAAKVAVLVGLAPKANITDLNINDIMSWL